MSIDKQKLQKLLWAEAASFRADCADWKRNTEELQEFLGEKTVEEVALELLAENERLAGGGQLLVRDRDDLRFERDQLKAENESLNSAIDDLERSRVAGFEEYDFTRIKGRAGAEKVFEITIETECGCDITEGEYTVRVTHLLGNWLGDDDFSLIEEAVAEVIGELKLPEEGHTTFIAYESGERQDVFWTKWFEIATVESVLAEVAA
ncbi:hypothetical protein [Pseudomonas moraviensis]|uniref:hypothetical protein n=1 Tax=Pseudomonas moraviensis TaxID=321662 RepID=UPI0020928FCB|nr:hypothetical protein [Pseudomonas moraviensis]UST60752.1 hypothetical protein NF672_09500 [Pseudomonas moraviensis]UST71140.1 hypothetical protein NF674_09450 [Pseudomonas moraviensis]